MSISFINGHPALFIEKERLVVAGDLHIGMEFKFRDKGFYFPGAGAKMAEQLKSICKSSNAKGIILLGDVKDRLLNVTTEEETVLRNFFKTLEGIPIRIVKGNHDAYLDRILKTIGIDIKLENEILLDKVALLHGNTMATREALLKDYIVTGHSHVAANVNGVDEKVWAMIKISKEAGKSYEKYNKKCKLIMAPAFNDMIIGTRINKDSKTNIPLVRRGVFDMNSLEIYNLWGNKIS